MRRSSISDDIRVPSAERLPRVLHFVTGGFSGATQVAADLVRAHRDNGTFEARLVLRHKRQTDPARIEALRREGLQVDVVSGALHALTMWQLRRLCLRWQPDILVAHGFSEHLWGRFAGLWAGVPHLVHVEHNSRERYTWWRRTQARWLAARTDRIIGCSEGVKASLLAMGMPPDKTIAISNGIRLEPYKEAAQRPLAQREPGIVMAARFARQKDHATLLKALQMLRQRGLTPTCWLPGGGRARTRERMQRLASRLGVHDQVRFLGFHSDVPGLLMQNRICVLASHYEGMPLSLIEGMAAGCVVVGSSVPGIQEVIDHGRNGLLVAHQDAHALADALASLLTDASKAQALARQGLHDAYALYSLERMLATYEREFASVLDKPLQPQ